ncbi:MAG: cobalamin biosynthesis protein CobG, partial [Sulfitobacter sp.]|nr:cobalamin biosynthesis protein CobG [Sulfitobacter sp.]
MPNDQSQPALSKAPKGGALNPVEAGDGLVLRIRPFNGRLRRAQADGIATLAAAHGNGLLDLSQQGTLQIRGVTDKGYPALIQGLHHMGLLDPTPQIEGQRNLLVSPFWVTGEETEEIAKALTQILSEEALTGLPPGITFAVDSGKNPVLQDAAADIRIERDAGGGLILLADGMTSGKPVSVRKAPLEAIALARWFADSRVDELSMAQLVEAGQHPEGH